MINRSEAAAGCLLGTAVGDAAGLACEGLSRRRQRKWYPSLERYGFFFGRGMCSDDTDHACMTAQAVAASGGKPRKFISSLAWRLRFWLLGLPAGVGFATLRGILKLWIFIPPQASGVRSAGNGPAMRSPVLGVLFADREPLLLMHVAASTMLTHTDRKAECGALAVALAARSAMRDEANDAYLAQLERFAAPFTQDGAELVSLARSAAQSAARGESSEAFAASLGCEDGVSGYAYHSVPVALHAWMRHRRDFEAAIQSAIRCGGDTDTVGAITGAIVGAAVGHAGIPARRLDDLWDWPRGPGWMQTVAANAVAAVDRGEGRLAVYPAPLRLLLRNIFFLLVVLGHGFRRLAPPY